MDSRLPNLQNGIYRHYKGPLYQVFGYAHDANADTLIHGEVRDSILRIDSRTLGERFVVVYIGLQLDEAHTGPRMAVRTVDDFFAWLHQDAFTICPKVDFVQARSELPYCSCAGPWYDRLTNRRTLGLSTDQLRQVVRRFTYVGASWEGDSNG